MLLSSELKKELKRSRRYGKDYACEQRPASSPRSEIRSVSRHHWFAEVWLEILSCIEVRTAESLDLPK